MKSIMIYGLNENEEGILDTVCTYRTALDAEDLKSAYAKITIINPERLSSEEKAELADYYREVELCDDRVILLNEDPFFNGISMVKVIPDFFENFRYYKPLLMADMTFGEMGKAILDIDDADEDFYKGVTEALSVYNSIEQNPGITTCKLSAELKLPEKIIGRYIRIIQAAHVLISYKNCGWKSYGFV